MGNFMASLLALIITLAIIVGGLYFGGILSVENYQTALLIAIFWREIVKVI